MRPRPNTPEPVVASPAERGLALLLVLLLSLILIPFTAEFAIQVSYETRTAQNVTDQLKIENAMDGQFEIMLARLRFDAESNDLDSFEDSWSDEDLLARKDEDVNVALTTHVFDEQGKLNLRMLAEGGPERRALWRKRLTRLLIEFRRDTSLELSRGEAENWTENIANYLSGGSMRANFPRPRMADNRPILILDELNLLPRIKDHPFAFLLADQREEDRVAPGLHRYVTIYGTGKVNLNTADLVVLKAFFPEDPQVAEDIVQRRESPPEEQEGSVDFGTEEDLGGNPFTDVNQVNEIEGVDPRVLERNEVDLAADFDVRSHFFSMRIVGETELNRRDELYVVERVPGPEPEAPIEGFRFLLHQERTDPLEELEEEDV